MCAHGHEKDVLKNRRVSSKCVMRLEYIYYIPQILLASS